MMPGIPKSSASPLIKASIPAGDQLVEPVIGAKLLSLSAELPRSGAMAMSLTCTHSSRGQSCQGFITSLCAAAAGEDHQPRTRRRNRELRHPAGVSSGGMLIITRHDRP